MRESVFKGLHLRIARPVLDFSAIRMVARSLSEMGNSPSTPLPQEPRTPEQAPRHMQAMEIPNRPKKLLGDSLVTGSPLTTVDTPDTYTQPVGEPSYKNSSRISHHFGPTGPKPLQSQKKDESLVPIIINWTQGGKTVYMTGSFNQWKQKIRLQKRCLANAALLIS
jgi:hypothetical protein